jgi:hypothetical protein
MGPLDMVENSKQELQVGTIIEHQQDKRNSKDTADIQDDTEQKLARSKKQHATGKKRQIDNEKGEDDRGQEGAADEEDGEKGVLTSQKKIRYKY